MAKPYPEGGTFFDSVKKSFADVEVDKSNNNAIPTSQFLEAAESLTTLFGKRNFFLLESWEGYGLLERQTYWGRQRLSL